MAPAKQYNNYSNGTIIGWMIRMGFFIWERDATTNPLLSWCCYRDAEIGICDRFLVRPKWVHSLFQGPWAHLHTALLLVQCSSLSHRLEIRVTFQSVSCGCDLSLEECPLRLCVSSLTLSHVLPKHPPERNKDTPLRGSLGLSEVLIDTLNEGFGPFSSMYTFGNLGS